MVAFAENKILKSGGRCNADADTQNYYVRNRYYLPTLGRWLTRDPIGYQGGINLYEYVQSSPVGNVDAEGEKVYTFRASREFSPINAGLIIAPPHLHLNYQYSFRYGDDDGTPFVSSLFNGRYSPGPEGGSLGYLSVGGGYRLDLGTEVIPDPGDRHAVLLVVKGVYAHYYSGQINVGAKGVSVPAGPRVSDVTKILTFYDTFLLYDHCGKVRVVYLQAAV